MLWLESWAKASDYCHRSQVIKRSKSKNQGGNRQKSSTPANTKCEENGVRSVYPLTNIRQY